MKNYNYLGIGFLFVFVGLFFYFLYVCHQNFMTLSCQIQNLQQIVGPTPKVLQMQAVDNQSDSDCINTAVSSQLWEKLQKKLSNTVIQLLVTREQHDILQPFKVPLAGQAAGSAFIFNPQGEIITNAHVVNGSTTIMAQMTCFGKHQFELDLVGIMPEKDVALLKFKQTDIDLIIKTLGAMPYLTLGDSDTVVRSQEILALGYPLGQQALKSTTGVISGREMGMIQMSAPINPGNSGGPSLNACGHVIGINSSGVLSAQNVGYIIPINDIKIFLQDLRAGGLIRKPYLGIYQTMSNLELLKALGNPAPGGCYIVDVMKDSPLYKKLQPGDMLYAINGIAVDMYGELSVPWSEDKVSVAEYVARMHVGQKVGLLIYRKGKKMEFECTFDRKKLLPVREVYVEYEPLSYECIGGYVIMPLMLNHVGLLANQVPKLVKYTEEKYQSKSVLLITYILPDSSAYRIRLPLIGSILTKINGIDVATLDDVKAALKKSTDVITLQTDDKIFVALDTEKVIAGEPILAAKNGYQITEGMKALINQKK